MKLGRFIVHNMRNIFLKNHTQNVMEILVPDAKKLCPHWRLARYITTCSPLALPHLNLFQETKTSLELVSYLIFSRFLEKNIFHVIFYWQTKFDRQTAFTYIYGYMCNAIICFPFCNVLNLHFETNLSLLIKSYFYMTKKLDNHLNKIEV